VLASNIASPLYTAVELTAGVIYQFKVESRNSYGYSAHSSSISLLCAYKPDPPLTLMTANSDNQVSITWTTPVTNGSPITSFKIYIRNIDLSFIQETSSCDGA
jgi:WD40 repeat protein